MQGFTISPYHWCIFNKTVNKKKCTIICHIDDLKISHMESKVVDDIIAAPKEEYEKVGMMTIHSGKVHELLDMTLDFSKPRKFIIKMEKYLDKMMRDLSGDMDEEVTSLAAEYLFKTRDSAVKLAAEQADISQTHSLTAVCVQERTPRHSKCSIIPVHQGKMPRPR